EVEARVLEGRRRRVEEAARPDGEDPVERVEVVRAADTHAERVVVAMHDQRIDVLEGTELRDLQARSVALRGGPPFVRAVELEIEPRRDAIRSRCRRVDERRA